RTGLGSANSSEASDPYIEPHATDATIQGNASAKRRSIEISRMRDDDLRHLRGAVARRPVSRPPRTVGSRMRALPPPATCGRVYFPPEATRPNIRPQIAEADRQAVRPSSLTCGPVAAATTPAADRIVIRRLGGGCPIAPRNRLETPASTTYIPSSGTLTRPPASVNPAADP